MQHDPTHTVELLGGIGIAQTEPFEATVALSKVFLAEFLDLLSAHVRCQGLDQQSRLRQGFISELSAANRKAKTQISTAMVRLSTQPREPLRL